jgi:outer membrane protein assembly factor BamB
VRLRYFPVALLTSMLVAAVLVRWTRRPPTKTGARAKPLMPADAGTPSLALRPTVDAAVPASTRMQHGDRRRAGRARARGPSAPHVRWKTSDLGAIETQPIPSLDETTIYVTSLAGKLVALSRADGSIRFTVDLGGRSYASPCVDDRGMVYVASDAKKLFAVQPDGRVAWTLDLDDEGDTACAVADDGAIVFAAGRTLESVSRAGDVRWRFLARRKIFTAPAIDDHGHVIVGSQDHHVYAVDGGRSAWSVDLGADVDGSPAIDDDGAIVVGTDGGEIVRLSTNGSVVWSAHVGGFVRGALTIARNGDVLSGVYGPRSRVVRLDGKTGREKASLDVPGSGATEMGVHGGPLEGAGGELYFGGQDDRVYVANVDGTVGTLATGGDVDAPITALSDGALVIASDDGAVYYLDP